MSGEEFYVRLLDDGTWEVDGTPAFDLEEVLGLLRADLVQLQHLATQPAREPVKGSVMQAWRGDTLLARWFVPHGTTLHLDADTQAWLNSQDAVFTVLES